MWGYNVYMQSAFEILSKPKVTFKRNSQRDVVMSDIYTIYVCEKQKVLRKKENWKRYIEYLKKNKVKHSKIQVEKFKKSKLFIKELPLSTLAVLLARNKVEVLYRILSEAKDLNGRGGNAGAFIINSRFI